MHQVMQKYNLEFSRAVVPNLFSVIFPCTQFNHPDFPPHVYKRKSSQNTLTIY